MNCSIVISTFNRAPQLRRLLAGLSRLEAGPFEVVVVNGPSTDGTDQLLQSYAGRLKVAHCPTRNVSQSRNLGIAAAAGEVVVFIDDDAFPTDSRWLARYQRAFLNDPGGHLGAAGGPVLRGDTQQYEFQGGMTSDYGLQIFELAKDGRLPTANQRWVSGVQGCNCAFRRSALIQIGGFDEFYTYYLDETDVCLRLARAGYGSLYLADNAVRHFPARAALTNSLVMRQWDTISRSDTYFALKNGADAWPRRLAKTLWLSPRKHFVKELLAHARDGSAPMSNRLKALTGYSRGYAQGLGAGVFTARRLDPFTQPPAAFLAFERVVAACPLRIALLSQSVPLQASYGGIARYTYDLALGLYERGHEVHIVCQDTQPLRHHGLGFFIHGLVGDGQNQQFQAGAAPYPILNKNLRHAVAVVKLLRELYAHGVEFDVVHASNWDTEAAALIRAQLYPVALMLVTPLAQTIASEGWPLTDDLRACVALDRWQIEHSDVVCTPSVGVRDTYARLMGLAPSAMQTWPVVPPGIVPDPIGGARRPGKRRLLFVGRLERRKGVHILLAVLPELLRLAPDWECHLVGDDQVPLTEGGTFRERFLTEHKGAPWLPRVYFHGTVSEEALRQYYRECDLFMAPSLYESYGLIYNEAMQYGKAVIGCRVGGVPDTVRDGIDGLLVPPEDSAALQQALAELMEDEARRQRMGQAGAQRVHQQVNYQTMAAGMEGAYRAAIAAVGPARRQRRAEVWARALPLLQPDEQLARSGKWQVRETFDGQAWLWGQAGAELRFSAAPRSWLELTLLRHAWSGLLEVRSSVGDVHYIDLYQPESQPADLNYCHRLPIAHQAADVVEVTIRVLTEHNPASHGCEAWLRQVALSVEAAA